MSVFHDIDANDDTIERIESSLPDAALAKVERINAVARERGSLVSDRRALNTSALARRQEWQSRKAHLENDVERHGVARTPEVNSELEKLERRIAKSFLESKQREEEIQSISPTIPPFILFDYLHDAARGTTYKDARVKVPETTDPRLALEKSRAEIAGLYKERGNVLRARLPRLAADANVDKQIAQKVASVKLDFTAASLLIQRSLTSAPEPGKVKWPKEYIETGTHLIEKDDAAGLLFLLLADRLKTIATDQLNEIYREKPFVVPQNEREQRLADIDAKIVAESRIEEALVEVHEAQGLEVLRRPNAHPLAVLGIAIDTSPKPTEDAAPAEVDDDFG